MSETKNPLTDEVKALIGVSAEKVEASPPWGIEREGLRIFTNAIMDPDPRYWDDEFAENNEIWRHRHAADLLFLYRPQDARRR